jgi:ribonuclease P protein component
MLAKKHRFYGQGGIRYINRKGQNIRGSLLTLKFAKNKDPESYRVAVVVSKKVTKSAPKRNRIRRRIYEYIRTEAVDSVKGNDIVLIVFSDKFATMPHDELSGAVRDLLLQIRT